MMAVLDRMSTACGRVSWLVWKAPAGAMAEVRSCMISQLLFLSRLGCADWFGAHTSRRLNLEPCARPGSSYAQPISGVPWRSRRGLSGPHENPSAGGAEFLACHRPVACMSNGPGSRWPRSRAFGKLAAVRSAAACASIPANGQLRERPMSTAPQPFKLHIGEADIADLRQRLARTRLPDEPPHEPWSSGASLAYMKGVTDYWRDGFDWRRW